MRSLHVLLKFPLVSSELSSYPPLRTPNTNVKVCWAGFQYAKTLQNVEMYVCSLFERDADLYIK